MVEKSVDDAFVDPRDVACQIRDEMSAGRPRGGFHGLLEHFIACGLALDFLEPIIREDGSNFFGRLENLLVKRLTIFVFVVKPKRVACHETISLPARHPAAFVDRNREMDAGTDTDAIQ